MIVLNEFSNGFFIAKLIAKVKDEVVIVMIPKNELATIQLLTTNINYNNNISLANTAMTAITS